MKVHKVTEAKYKEAIRFRRANGFINPAVSSAMDPLCGIEPLVITPDWSKVTCKRCLAKKTRGGRDV